MEPVETVLRAAVTAPAASGLRESADGVSGPEPSTAGEPTGQSSEVYLSLSSAALRLTLHAVEQCCVALELRQGTEEAATMTGVEIGREHAPGTNLAPCLDLYA